MRFVQIINIAVVGLLFAAASAFAGQGMGPGPGVKGYASGVSTISYGSYASAQNLTTADLVINKPTGTVEGNLLIVTIIDDTGSTPAITLPDGWTLLNDLLAASSLTTVAYKVAGASEGDTYTFTNTNTYKAGIISRFTKSGGTWDIEASSEIEATGDVTTASVTATDNSMLVLCFGSDDAGTFTAGYPADMTLIKQESPGSAEAAMWYEARSAGAVQKVIDMVGGGDNVGIAVVVDLVP